MIGHESPKLGQGCPMKATANLIPFAVPSKLFKVEVMVTIRTYTLRTAPAPRFVALVGQLRLRCGCSFRSILTV